MSIRKKVVWLPYDMDTAIGINNEGSLAFSYNLEDIDQTEGGADVYNGQNSVMWVNLRQAFGPELKQMYQSLRSTGTLSYPVIEQMFEQHQNKWPQAIFNEDALFKYLEPLFNDNDAAYLSMLQGSKAQQRKWWLYNRFRYLDSKYNAGDALTDVITLRGYALGNITVTPYADIYPTIKYGSYLVQTRGTRGQAYTLINPLDAVNDTEIYIYSASQLASVGDISPLKVGYANFSFATKLQDIKIGDSDPNYSNGNLKELYLGNNTLLQTLDVRNCPNLIQTVDLKGCTNIEEVYFDGTGIAGVELPNGGVLNTLHLPGSITNLTIRNQPQLVDLTVDDYSNISTLWLENAGIAGEASKQIVCDISDNARVRLLGIDWEMEDAGEFEEVFNKINTYRGLDEQGGNMNVAQLTGEVYTPTAAKSFFNNVVSKYPYVNFSADELQNLVKIFLEAQMRTYNDNVITSIRSYAFTGYESLIKINLPNVVTINSNSFQNCPLTEISLPKVKTIGDNAFLSCPKIGDVDLPAVTWIGKSAFSKSGITSINAPSYTEWLGETAFSGCKSLREINLPNLTKAYGSGFEGCTSLEEVTLPSLQNFDRYGLFRNCTNLKKAYFPSLQGQGSSSDSIFMNCTNLRLVELNIIKNIRLNNFNNCQNLIAIILRRTEVVTLNNISAFDQTKYASDGEGNAYIYVPRDLIASYQIATNWTTLYEAHSDVFRPLQDYTIDGTITGKLDESLMGVT